MNYSLVFHTYVEADLAEAFNWYEDKQNGLGERFLNELVFCYNLIESNPELCGRVSKSYRKISLRHFPYIIVFEIADDHVLVYAVFHTSRNPKEIEKRKK
jgi:plasmid stabilization system protein ParE